MYSYFKLSLLALACALLAACSSVNELELSSYQTGIYLTIEPSNKSDQKDLTAKHIIDSQQFTYSILPERPLLAIKDGLLTRVEASDAPKFVAKGYTIENEQQVEAFANTLSESYAEVFQYEKLWQSSQGEGITIALIDSGFSPNPADAKEAILPGYDFINQHEGANDENGHGTKVASLIVGQGRIKGIAPKAQILPLKVLDKNNKGSSFDVIRALYYAADLLPDLKNPYKADVVNLSLGSTSYSPGMHEAIKRLNALGIIVVAAVGNVPSQVAFPAALPEVVAVGAADLTPSGWHLSPYSGYGEGITILAPMTGILARKGETKVFGPEASTAKGDSESVTGTSFAAPQVTGVLALLLAKGASASAALAIMEQSSSDLFTPGLDTQSGFGLLNPWAALRSVDSKSKSTSRFAVQVLDSESLQEIMFAEVKAEKFLSLASGRYHLVIWEDLNQDGLWDRAHENSFQSLPKQTIEVKEGETLEMTIKLD